MPAEFANPWTSHIIASGPDVYFRAVTLKTPSGDFDAIITAGFFSERIDIFWTTDPAKKWTISSKVYKYVCVNLYVKATMLISPSETH